MVMFEWKNLPDTIDERYLERTLFLEGQALFFKDEVLGYLALKTTTQGRLNIYDVPTVRRAYSASGYRAERDESDSVIIYNNYLRTPSIDPCYHYARRLADLEQAIDVNCKAQKTPVMILADENQRLSMVNLYEKYEGNYPFIFGDKSVDMSSVRAISTGAPFVAEKMFEIKIRVWNEALTDLGISNISYQKKERLVSDEVIRSMGGTIASRYSRLQMRRQACEKINEMFGLNIECNYREDFREADGEVMIESDSEDSGNSTMSVDLRPN